MMELTNTNLIFRNVYIKAFIYVNARFNVVCLILLAIISYLAYPSPEMNKIIPYINEYAYSLRIGFNKRYLIR